MSRRKGGFFGWLRKLFARSKNPEMTTLYNPAPVQQQYHNHQQQQFQQYQQQQYNKEFGNGQAYHPPSGYRQDQSVFSHHQQQHQQRADEIAQIQVAGMRRTAGSGYVPAYANRTAGPDPDAVSSSRPYDQMTVSSYGGTNGMAWGSEDKYEKHQQPQADSAWRGKPIGKQYDRREELTEEDEDMWARMAM